MALIVQKYGGTSVGTHRPHQERRAARRALPPRGPPARRRRVGDDAARPTGCSALAKELSASPDPRELDVVAATGEQVTIGLLAIALQEMGIKAQELHRRPGAASSPTARSPRRASSTIDEARDARATSTTGTIVIVAGFQGVDDEGNITTLGRGGSDTSGVALAAALKADECQIYTDVDGVYTTDPRIVPEARRLDTITFEEMLEMASLGLEGAADPLGRVRRQVQGQAARAVVVRGSRVRRPRARSSPTRKTTHMEQAIISGIAFNRDEAKISVMGVEDRPGIAYAILGPIAAANIDVDMIVQNIGASGHTDFSFTVNRSEYQKALDVLARRARQDVQGARDHRRQPDLQGVASSASACARTSASRARCSRRSPTRASTSR